MDPPTLPFPVRDFAIALFVGALVGIERERRPEARRDVGGVRTFTLFALVGAVAGWLTRTLGTPWVLVAGVAAVAAAVIVDHATRPREEGGSRGLTTEAAAIAVCLLGGAATLGHPELAVTLGIAVSALLAFKDPIHGLIARIGRDDFYAAMKLLVAVFVVLPLLPDRTIDPWETVNPYTTGWLVVLVSGLSFAGYVAVRFLGAARGLAVTGFFGGLVSSTAVTLGFARRSRDEGAAALQDALASGVLLAWTVMSVRVVVIVAVAHAPLAAALWPPFAAMGAVTLVSALVLAWRGSKAATANAAAATAAPDAATAGPAASDVALRNPFSLTEAAKFAVVFTAVVLAVELLRRYVSSEAIYAVAALAGATDVDAITLSMAKVAERGDVATASVAILIAALSNTIVKAGMVAALGSPGLRRRVVVVAGIATAAALVTAAL